MGCPRQESEIRWVVLQIPDRIPMRMAYSDAIQLTMRCLLGDDQYATGFRFLFTPGLHKLVGMPHLDDHI